MTCHQLHHFVFVNVVLTVPSELLSAAAHNRSINNSAAPVLTFVRTIFPGVWEVSVMRHGGQASDEIEDDLYQYNII